MKFGQLLLSSTVLLAVTQAAGYSYSAGWSPGQQTKAQPTPTAAAAYKPAATQPAGVKQSWTSFFLNSGPIGSLLSRSGINITEKLEEAENNAKLPWDERIPLITDDNYEELIFNETFATSEEEAERVWFLVVSVTASQLTGMSAYVDAQFNEAYNTSLIEGDLPNVRWGRIDYLNVTRLTTKWVVWKAPMLIVAKDRGKTLRFFMPQQIGGRAEMIREFLLNNIWERVPAWTGPWAPGGSREHLLHKFAISQEYLYFYVSKLPRWVLLIISGTFGSLLLSVLHRKPANPAKPVAAPKAKAKEDPTTHGVKPDAKAASSSVEAKKSTPQKRKSNKK
ncbi:hypothetical protein M422DRAFT_62484 [Sphaerobolus stellatus SS14]|nr:hypothetical protein M422DRAFT_62484 [Sphaerobolus stellatus SS14]